MKFNIGDKVMCNSKLYKVLHIYDNKELKLQSVRGKTNDIIFRVPFNMVHKQKGSEQA